MEVPTRTATAQDNLCSFGAGRLSPQLRKWRQITDRKGNIFENSPGQGRADSSAWALTAVSPGSWASAATSPVRWALASPGRCRSSSPTARIGFQMRSSGATPLEEELDEVEEEGATVPRVTRPRRALSVPAVAIQAPQQRTYEVEYHGEEGSDGRQPSWWGGLVKGVHRRAKKATVVVQQASHAISEEVQTNVRVMRALHHDLVEELQTTAHATAQKILRRGPDSAPASSQSKAVPLRAIEWTVDLHRSRQSTKLGLSLQPTRDPMAAGQPLIVRGVMPQSALQAWNDAKRPVSVRLLPGEREAVLCNIFVLPGDEIIASDGQPVGRRSVELREADIWRLGRCRALTLRREVAQAEAMPQAPAHASAGGA